MDTVLTKQDIIRRLEAMRSKRKRGFTMRMFASFAAIGYRHMESITRDGSSTFTELTFEAWNGDRNDPIGHQNEGRNHQ